MSGEEEDEERRGSGKGKGKGGGRGEGGEGEGEGDGDGDGNGDGNGRGQGQGQGQGQGGAGANAGGGGGTGHARGKTSLDEVSELPDPGQFASVANPAVLEPPTGARGAAAARDESDDAALAAASQALRREQFDATLRKIGMSEFDKDKYDKYRGAVRDEVRELRAVLDSLESKEHERVWSKNQTVGDLDEQRLIDGLTGERAIYKRRKEADPDHLLSLKPKRLSFVFDVSMSMARYASDGRLERSLEAAVMVMEALKGFERKFDYRLSGHSGSTSELVLVPWGRPPANDKARLDVIRAMHAHTEMCDSGECVALVAPPRPARD